MQKLQGLVQVSICCTTAGLMWSGCSLLCGDVVWQPLVWHMMWSGCSLLSGDVVYGCSILCGDVVWLQPLVWGCSMAAASCVGMWYGCSLCVAHDVVWLQPLCGTWCGLAAAFVWHMMWSGCSLLCGDVVWLQSIVWRCGICLQPLVWHMMCIQVSCIRGAGCQHTACLYHWCSLLSPLIHPALTIRLQSWCLVHWGHNKVTTLPLESEGPFRVILVSHREAWLASTTSSWCYVNMFMNLHFNYNL